MSDTLDFEHVREILEGACIYEPGMNEETMSKLYSFITDGNHTTDKQSKTTEAFIDLLETSEPTTSKNAKPLQLKPRKNIELEEDELPIKRTTRSKKCIDNHKPTEKLTQTNQKLIESTETSTKSPVSIERTQKPTKNNQKPAKNIKTSTKTLQDKQISSVTTNHNNTSFKPFYFTEEFQKMSLFKRTTEIANYHLKLSSNLYNRQRKSLNFVEWGKPIQPSDKFNGSLVKTLNTKEDEEEEYINNNNNSEGIENLDINTNDVTYDSFVPSQNNTELVESVSRYGRNRFNKRKLYMEMDDDIEIETKKPKPRGKAIKNVKSTALDTKSPQTRSRSEMLFDNLREDNNAKKQAEIEREKFEATLRHDSDDSTDYDLKITSYKMGKDDDFVDPKADVYEKKVYIPPIASKRGYKRKQGFEMVPFVKTVPDVIENVDAYEELSSSSDRSPNKNETTCPICSKLFSLKEIQNHASNCGISKTIQIENSWGVIMCDVCDKVFELNTDYEVHVTECVRKQKRN